MSECRVMLDEGATGAAEAWICTAQWRSRVQGRASHMKWVGNEVREDDWCWIQMEAAGLDVNCNRVRAGARAAFMS